MLLVGLVATLAVALVAAVSVNALRGAPAVELRPAGLLVREPLGTQMVPWPALRPGGPSRPVGRLSAVDPIVDRPDLVRRGLTLGRTALTLPTQWLDIHPWVAIGAAAEHDRLVATLTACNEARAGKH
jgi:hypothetical protein